MAHPTLSNHILASLRRGVMTAGDLQARMGVSPATVRRALDELGNQRILRIGRGRATRYGARRTPAHCGGTSWPLHEVTDRGTIFQFATLHALEADQWYVEPIGGYPAAPMQTGSDRGVFDGLPWFMDIARPQGFLGRLFVNQAHRRMGLPQDLALWTDDHVLASALVLGDDMLGNLLIGQAALRFSQKGEGVVSERDYPAALLAGVSAVLHGETVGSSAAGEQPKFTLTVRMANGILSHRMIKFSPEMETAGSRRWGDLLIAEHLANVVLNGAGIPAARTGIRVLENRVYLESERFDRCTDQGRYGLTAIGPPAHTLGYSGNQWPGAADVLAEAGLLTREQTDRVRLVHAFGLGIGNSDMHLGNLSLLGSISSGWTLSPVYDMTPMVYAPGRTMEVVAGTRDLAVNTLPPDVVPLVRRFWTAVAQDNRISSDFQAVARHHVFTLEHAETGIPQGPLAARRGHGGP